MLVATLVAGGFQLREFIKERNARKDLNVQIASVETALSAIKSVERNLSDVKSELQRTAAEKKKVEEEWERAKALQTLTKEQYAALRSAVTERSWGTLITDNFWAFILGVTSSLLASYLWTWSRRGPPE